MSLLGAANTSDSRRDTLVLGCRSMEDTHRITQANRLCSDDNSTRRMLVAVNFLHGQSRPFPVVNVSEGSQPHYDLSGAVAQRRNVNELPPEGAISTSEPVFDIITFAATEGCSPGVFAS
jgi:hypothetical protein